jgi:hypothetical protein
MSDTVDTEMDALERPADATPVVKLAQRDGAIVLAALSLWAAAEAFHASTGLGFAALLSTLDGLVVGVALGSVFHEWGHFTGARLGGGIAPTRPFKSLFPIFILDLERSDASAFRAMSVGGNVGHWLVVAFLVLALPYTSPGQIALLSGAFGFAVFASVTELPIIQHAFAGASPKESFKGLTGAVLRKNQKTGAVAGLLLFLFLAL